MATDGRDISISNVNGAVSFSVGGGVINIDQVTDLGSRQDEDRYKEFSDFLNFFLNESDISEKDLNAADLNYALEDLFNLTRTTVNEEVNLQICMALEYITNRLKPTAEPLLLWLLDHPELTSEHKKQYRKLIRSIQS